MKAKALAGNQRSNEHESQRPRDVDIRDFFEDGQNGKRLAVVTLICGALYIPSSYLKVTDGKDSIEDPISIAFVCFFVLAGYTLIHPSLVLSPKARKEKLKYDLHNFGPGEAKSFASIIKVGLRNKDVVQKHLDAYKQKQKIGTDGSTDFMTSKLVILFPGNLVSYAETFEITRKTSLMNRRQEDGRQWVPVNSQGIVHLDKWKRSLDGEEIKLETAPEFVVEYEMSGATRQWTCNVISWLDKRNGKPPKTWYFLTFDNKPLEHILEWYNDNKETLSASEIQRQVELFRECLKKELDDDPDCVGHYYFLDFQEKLSDSILSLLKDIENREGRKLN